MTDAGGGGGQGSGNSELHVGACGYTESGNGTVNIRSANSTTGGFSYNSDRHEIAFDVSIANDSAEDAPPFSVGFYLYPDAQAPCEGYLAAVHRISNGLQYYDTGFFYLDLRGTIDTRDIEDVPAGTYHFGYVVDYLNEVDEGRENDNIHIWDSRFSYSP